MANEMAYSPLLNLYEKEMPSELCPFTEVPPFLRLKDVGMNCGLEYTSYPFFQGRKRLTRYSHSLGVYRIVYHFTKDPKQALSGLYHDIATPCFSHVIDFLKGDYTKQEATEDETHAIIAACPEIQALLKPLGLKTEDIDDYHRYPIADNPTPQLSADRLEYHLGNLLQFGFATFADVQVIYGDLIRGRNEKGEDEILFKDKDIAVDFLRRSLENSRVYISPEDRYSMNRLAYLIKAAIQNKAITLEDLYLTESELIQKLQAHPQSSKDWQTYCSLSRIEERDSAIPGSMKVLSKKRYVDPYVQGLGRLSRIDGNCREMIENFKNISFDKWLFGN